MKGSHRRVVIKSQRLATVHSSSQCHQRLLYTGPEVVRCDGRVEGFCSVNVRQVEELLLKHNSVLSVTSTAVFLHFFFGKTLFTLSRQVQSGTGLPGIEEVYVLPVCRLRGRMERWRQI